jgi:cysteine desulfuration protein SufE
MQLLRPILVGLKIQKKMMPSKTLKTRVEEILAEFDALPDVDAKYMHLFQQGLDLPTLDPSLKTEVNKVRGCQSDLWFHLECQDGRLHLAAESDSMVISGIAALIARIVESCRPEDMEDLNLDFIDRLEIWKLPSERNNSLVAMLSHLKNEAREIHKAKKEP